MKQIFWDIIFFTMLICAVVSSFIVGFVSGHENITKNDFIGFVNFEDTSINNSNFSSIGDMVIEVCRNKSLIDMSKCMGKGLDQIFNYNISNIGREMTYQQVVTEGGVCSHYAEIYKDWAVSLGAQYIRPGDERRVFENDTGLYVSYVIVHSSNRTTHKFSVLSNNEGYCILDQTNVKCIEFGSPIKEKQ
jgi:hypothetical protein